jgi:hypothetical protein
MLERNDKSDANQRARNPVATDTQVRATKPLQETNKTHAKKERQTD